MVVGEGWVKVAAPIVAGNWEDIFGMKKMRELLQKDCGKSGAQANII
jgi:hypothetical protein